MMNKIWTIIVVLSISFSVFYGNVTEINHVILTVANEALIQFGFIAGNIILWNGILNVAINTGFIKFVSCVIKPIIKPFFRTRNDLILDCIAANLACNFFALSSASTPFAIKAMELMKEDNNSDKESKDMATLIIINVCGFTFIPSSLLTVRESFNASNNSIVVFYIILFSFSVTAIMLLINYVVGKWT